ncbi:hypothetical protein SAMN04515674_114103 [Pseudarcicella hirudinis]|uniref:Uncharacterized protein n=1 Tax=Pseudarcicella hirudinis TaxID=1079859 RepID=A0A1I5XF14_9BACT|nr:hypothetical protein SAMN04515674_114103 [Pseudarcicella hirudinis]
MRANNRADSCSELNRRYYLLKYKCKDMQEPYCPAFYVLIREILR